MRKLLMLLMVVLGLAGLVAVASAHMWDGGPAGRQGYYPGYGWNGGMGPGGMHSGMGPGAMHSGMGPGRMHSGMGPGAMHSGMGPGRMHSGMGPGWMHGSGYNCNGPAGTSSAAASSMKLLPPDEVQKSVEAFAGKSFPGFKVGTVEKDDYGRPFYSAPLIGNDSRFEVQVNAFDGRVTGIFPVQE